MDQGNSVPRVSGGLPWWLWLTAIVVSAMVAIAILAELNKKTSEEIFAEAMQSIELRDKDQFREKLEEYRLSDGDPDRLRILEGIDAGATTRYPRSVQILEPYVEHENPELRNLAIKYCAESYQALGDAKSARRLHLRYAEMEPTDVRPLLLVLELYRVAGATQLTIDTAKAILELDPEDRATTEALAVAQGELGLLDEAISTASTLLESATDRSMASPNIVNRYVAWLLEAGEYEKAAEFVSESSLLVSDNSARIFTWLRSGQVDKVQETIQQTKTADTHALAIWASAAAAMEAQDWEKAVRQMGQVSLQLPRTALVYEMMETAATNNNQPELAEACRANVEAIEALKKEKFAAIAAIGDDMEDHQLRLNVVEVVAQLTKSPEKQRWVQAAIAVSDNTLTSNDVTTRYPTAYTPLVPISGAFGTAPSDAAGTSKTETEESSETSSQGTESSDASGESSEESEDTTPDSTDSGTETSTEDSTEAAE